MTRNLADDFEDQLAALGRVGGDAEGLFHALGSLFQVLFVRVVEAAQNTAFFHALTGFDFEDDAHGRIDHGVLGVAARTDDGGRQPDLFRSCRRPGFSTRRRIAVTVSSRRSLESCGSRSRNSNSCRNAGHREHWWMRVAPTTAPFSWAFVAIASTSLRAYAATPSLSAAAMKWP